MQLEGVTPLVTPHLQPIKNPARRQGLVFGNSGK